MWESTHKQEEVTLSEKDKWSRIQPNDHHKRCTLMGDSNGYKARCHSTGEWGRGDDEFFSTGLVESARASLTCIQLDPEELLIQAEEMAAEPRKAEWPDYPDSCFSSVDDGGGYDERDEFYYRI